MDFTRDSLIPRKRTSISSVRSTNFLTSIDSNIPLNLSSDRKRKRLSLLPSNIKIGAPRLLHQQPNFRRQSSFNLTPSNPSVQDMVPTFARKSGIPRRLSIAQQAQPPSSGGRPFDNSILNTPSTNRLYGSQPKDPRPLRDHNFQLNVQSELLDFLSTNKFDIEMKHSLTNKTVKNPTQKDFVLIFQWLYKKIDPGYKFIRTIEQEVYSVLKFLEYPYLETINKSQISAVGGSNWPVFLGMLHWLMKLVIETSKFDGIDLNSIQESQNLTLNNSVLYDQSIEDSVISKEQSLVDKLFIRYALKSYKAFLATGENNYDSYFQAMQKDYEIYTKEVDNKTQSLLDENSSLQSVLETIQSKHEQLHSQVERTNALEADVTKFQNYVDIQKQRRLKWPNVIKKAQVDIDNIEDSIAQINKEKEDIRRDLHSRNFTLQDIEEMHKDRARLSSSLNMLDLKQKSLYEAVDTKISSLKTNFSTLQSQIDTYNVTIFKILNVLCLPSPPDPTTFTISSLPDDYQSSSLGLQPHEILSTLPTLRLSITTLKSTIQTYTSSIQDDTLHYQEKLDDLKLSIVSHKDRLEELEDKLSKSRKEYTDLNEQFNTDVSTKQYELEEKSKEIRLFNLQTLEYRKKTESRWKETQKEFKNVLQSLGERRMKLVCDLTECMDHVVNFKSDVMMDLENSVVSLKNEYNDEVKRLD